MILAAFILGFAGSLHCAVMCGPLALAVPVASHSRSALILSRLVYNAGRITTYAALGLLFGAVGKSLALAGFQGWLSIAAGTAMILFLFLGTRGLKNPLWKGPLWVKSLFRRFLNQRSYRSAFVLGTANGLLPCGLVYMAATASAASGDILQSALYMSIFGLGTLPMMLGIMVFGPSFCRLLPHVKFQSLAPIAVAVVAVCLILRGMSLGIPYLSPEIAAGTIHCPACLE